MSAPKITREMHERRRRIRSYKELMQECFSLRKSGAWISTVGKSTFGRNIILISIGDGRKRVLVICRQHGNEPTSMEAMLDYTQELLIGSKYKGLMKKVRLFLIPTANPDGAELYNYVCRKGKTSILTSYIARSIKPYRGDINRDHRKKKTPEAQAIWNTVKEVSPDVILDLHNFFHSYEYFILKKPIHNFCPACSTNSEIDPEVLRKSYRICKIARIAVEKVGGNPAKINGFWTGIYGRLLMAREDVLHTYYPLTLRIPSATFEAKGGFNFCWKRLNEGKRLHRAAVDAVVKALAKKKLG